MPLTIRLESYLCPLVSTSHRLQWALNGLLPANFFNTVAQLRSPSMGHPPPWNEGSSLSLSWNWNFRWALRWLYEGTRLLPMAWTVFISVYCVEDRIHIIMGYATSRLGYLVRRNRFRSAHCHTSKTARPNAGGGAVRAKYSVTMFNPNGSSRVFTEVIILLTTSLPSS